MKNTLKALIFVVGFSLISIGQAQTDEPSTTDTTEWQCAVTADLLDGVWTYVSILKENKTDSEHPVSLAKFSERDTMFLTNGEFGYDIEALNKHSMGRFSLIYDSTENACILQFDYTPTNESDKPVRRLFKIEKITLNSLVISEGPLSFHYNRRS
jgi:hypothetical protein